MCFSIKKIVKLFESGNVCVFGLRGTGKDLLTANVIARRNRPYISNFNYKVEKDNIFDKCYSIHFPLNFDYLDIKTTYHDLISGKVKHYDFEYYYSTGSDIYVSDCGIYFPSQYNNELNKKYPFLANYQALSRQLSRNNFHINTQNLNRVYDKIREQSDIYIMCLWCKVFCGFVFQKVRIYDKYQSAVDRVAPNRITVPLFADKQVKTDARIYCDKFFNQYGSIKEYLLIYKNKSSYDSYYFDTLLKEGEKYD